MKDPIIESYGADVFSEKAIRRFLPRPVAAKLIASMLTSLLDKLILTGLLNRLLGGLFGVVKYALVLGAFIWLFSSMNLIKEEMMQESRLAGPLKAFPEFIYNNVFSHSEKE